MVIRSLYFCYLFLFKRFVHEFSTIRSESLKRTSQLIYNNDELMMTLNIIYYKMENSSWPYLLPLDSNRQQLMNNHHQTIRSIINNIHTDIIINILLLYEIQLIIITPIMIYLFVLWSMIIILSSHCIHLWLNQWLIL